MDYVWPDNETISMFERTAGFVQKHLCDDVSTLLLGRRKWPNVDMDLAVASILSRRKLSGKVPSWCMNPRLVFPSALSAEQCSGSEAALYKASLAVRIVHCGTLGAEIGSGFRLADLTGGLGVDSWHFSQAGGSVLYCEMNPALCKAAAWNFNCLQGGRMTAEGPDDTGVPSKAGTGNIMVVNRTVEAGTVAGILGDFRPDMIYLDPARRDDAGRKVFLIEDCRPDILGLKEELFAQCRHVLVKLSPMADITMVCNRLGPCCREVHVVTVAGECKEVLVWMDRDFCGEPEIICASRGSGFRFRRSEESSAVATMLDTMPGIGEILFEPDKGLMKAGAYKTISERFALPLFGKSTHFYLVPRCRKEMEEMLKFGKTYEIVECLKFSKEALRHVARQYPSADVTARNLPMDTNTLRKKLQKMSGDEKCGNIHIFALRTDFCGDLLIAARRVPAINSGVQDEAGQAQPSLD